MIGFYNYTVILTYISLLISSVGVCFAMSDDPFAAILCLLASGVCDMFDGKIARTRQKSTDEERRFGIQLDSLCDIVCFGVLPAAIGVSVVSQSGAIRYAAWGTGALLILCGLIRLAYFNVTEETRQASGQGRRTHFEGLPITSSAVIFPFAYTVSLLVGAWVYVAFAAVTAVCFITPFRLRKPYGARLVIVGLLGLAELVFLLLVQLGVIG